ncbi:MAG: hypothetical protein ACKOAU_21485 [Pirellula sp.]
MSNRRVSLFPKFFWQKITSDPLNSIIPPDRYAKQMSYRGSNTMSHDPSIHPLDRPEDDELERFASRRDKSATNRLARGPVWTILLTLGLICLAITLAGTAMLNTAPNSSTERLGQLLWPIGSIGMLLCCFITLGLGRSKQIQGMYKGTTAWYGESRTNWVALLIRSILGYILLAILLFVLHSALGSIRVMLLLLYAFPIVAGLVFSLIGTCKGRVRAYWIGIATSLTLGSIGNFYMMAATQAGFYNSPSINPNYGNRSYYTDAGGSTSLSFPATNRLFVARLLMSQLISIALAMLNGLACSGLIACLERFSKGSRAQEAKQNSQVSEKPLP